jgi:hypothetical protein
VERAQQAPSPDQRQPLVLVGSPAGTAPAAPVDREQELIRVCLVCGAELEDRACKLVCRCGYFLSCSDYL